MYNVTIASHIIETALYTKNTFRLTQKEVAVELPPLWCKLTRTFILKQLEAKIFPVITVKHYYLS